MWLVSACGFVLLPSIADQARAHVIPRNASNAYIPSGTIPQNLKIQRDSIDDPTAFTWVQRFAAIGDSYTAGVGSGSRLGGIFDIGSWWCSRYDQSYPVLMKEFVGSEIEDFQFPACFGDQTWQIYNQATALKNNIDLLTITAGGNDLCLSDIIKNCVILAFDGDATCNAILDKAQENLDSIVKDNVKQILKALDSKMAKDGVVVYNGYARFFNEDNEDCATKQDWAPFYWYRYLQGSASPLPLTVDRRKSFNKLTTALNDALRDVVHDVADEVSYKIGYASWDLWGIDGVKGQMCDPSSTGTYPDPKQPDLLFFKPDTSKSIWRFPLKKKRSANGTETLYVDLDSTVDGEVVGEWDTSVPPTEEQREALRASLPPLPERDLDSNGVDRAVYRSILWNSVNPPAAALKALDKRAPATPGCPGDPYPYLPNVGWFLPDYFGRIFHPNEAGHNAIASFAIQRAIDLRAEVLGINPEVCTVTDEFKCWQKEGRKGYATADRLNENYKTYCDGVKAPGGGVTGWQDSRKFHEGTPDEHEFVVETSEFASAFNHDECIESMERIINGCDGNDPNNPMNWKFGGTWKRGEYRYTVNVKRDNRPWPPITKPYGKCDGGYHAVYSAYTMYGAGWSSWDSGQDTIIPKMKGCLGLGITSWKFQYFDEPDSDGMEWKASFHTPIFVNNRCFKNNKVAIGAGGFTDGCGGSGWA
ncbi:SGNH hydrolase-type esterase domain-containing protein [Daldinia loculata]|nr:SGNH hydrolase-type esterase domain-containing protein [Daldinia loculata]